MVVPPSQHTDCGGTDRFDIQTPPVLLIVGVHANTRGLWRRAGSRMHKPAIGLLVLMHVGRGKQRVEADDRDLFASGACGDAKPRSIPFGKNEKPSGFNQVYSGSTQSWRVYSRVRVFLELRRALRRAEGSGLRLPVDWRLFGWSSAGAAGGLSTARQGGDMPVICSSLRATCNSSEGGRGHSPGPSRRAAPVGTPSSRSARPRRWAAACRPGTPAACRRGSAAGRSLRTERSGRDSLGF
jgi:hypothetical protein